MTSSVRTTPSAKFEDNSVVSSSRRRSALLCRTALCGAVAVSLALPAAAQLKNPKVTHGSAKFSTNGKQTTVRTRTNTTIINYDQVNVLADQKVRFKQPNKNALTVNRVTGRNAPSTIAGQLSSNGNVWVLNPAGVAISRGAKVKVNGFLATTAAISDEDIIAGRHSFSGAPDGSTVVNDGRIIAETGGVVMVAPVVENTGEIVTTRGDIALAAASDFTVDFDGDGLTRFQVDGDGGVRLDNSGEITANGGAVYITASAAEDVQEQIVSIGGAVEATRIEERGGVIVISGGSSGVTEISGSLDVADATGKGGSVTVTGAEVVLTDTARIDASGATGGGSVRVGGAARGADLDVPVVRQATAPEAAPIPRARSVRVAEGTTIRADATTVGNGGEVILWADADMSFFGSISAMGGVEGGDGGFAEVSGRQDLLFAGLVDLSAPDGLFGTLLLDPTDITISNEDDSANNINAGTLLTALETANVTISTADGATNVGSGDNPADGADAGDITIAAGLDEITLANARVLTFEADNDINVDADIAEAAGSEALSIVFDAEGALNVNALVTVSGDIGVTASDVAIFAGGELATPDGTVSFAHAADGRIELGAGGDGFRLNQAELDRIDATRIDITAPGGVQIETATITDKALTIDITGDSTLSAVGLDVGDLEVTASNIAEDIFMGESSATTARFTDAEGDNITIGGEGGINPAALVGDTATFITAGDITVEDLTIRTGAGVNLGLNAGGNVVVEGELNVTSVTVETAVTISDGEAGRIVAETGTFNAIGDDSGSTPIAANITLDGTNNFTGNTVNLTGDNAVVNDVNAIVLGAVDLTGDLTVSAEGEITDTAETAITVGGVTSLVAEEVIEGTVTLFDIVLDSTDADGNPIHDFADEDTGRFDARGDRVEVVDSDGIALGEIEARNLVVRAAGAIVDTEGLAITASNRSDLTAQSVDGATRFDITLDSTFADSDAALHDLANEVAPNGRIDATGGVVTLVNRGALDLGVIDADDLIVRASGDIADTGTRTIVVSGQTSITSDSTFEDGSPDPGNMVFDNEGHDFGDLDPDLTDNDIVRFDAVARDVTVVDADGIALGTGSVQSLTVTADGDIVDADGVGITVAGVTSLTALNSGDVILDSTDGDGAGLHDFADIGDDSGEVPTQIDVVAGSATLTDIDGIALGTITVETDLIVTAGGDIVDVAGNRVRADGVTSLTALNGADVLLDNALNGAGDAGEHFFPEATATVSASGTNVTINNREGIVLGAFDLDGDLTIGAEGAISDSGDGVSAIVIDGTTSLTAADGNDRFALTLDDVDGDGNTIHDFNADDPNVGAGQNIAGGDASPVNAFGETITLSDANRIVLGSIDATGDVTITSNDIQIDQTVTIADGSILTLASTGGEIGLGDIAGAGIDDFDAGYLLSSTDVDNIDANRVVITADTIRSNNFDTGISEDGLAIDILDLRADSVVFTQNNGTDIIRGNLELTATTSVTQGATGSLQVSGTSDLSVDIGGTIDLSSANNDFTGTVNATGGDTSVADSNLITLGEVSVTGLTVAAADVAMLNDGDSAPDIVVADADGNAGTATFINLSGSDVVLGDVSDVLLDAGGYFETANLRDGVFHLTDAEVDDVSAALISVETNDSDALVTDLTPANAPTFEIVAGTGEVRLANEVSEFENLTVASASTVAHGFTDSDGIFDAFSGTVELDAVGVTVTGIADFTASDQIDLTNARNDFADNAAGRIDLAGSAANTSALVVDRDGIALGAIDINTLEVEAAGDIVDTANQIIAIDGEATLTAFAASDSGDETGGAPQLFDVVLDNALNGTPNTDTNEHQIADGAVISVLADNVVINNTFGLTLGDISADGTLTVAAEGTVVDNSAGSSIEVAGDLSVTASEGANAFDIALHSGDHIIDGSINLEGGDIAIVTVGDVVLGNITASANADATLNGSAAERIAGDQLLDGINDGDVLIGTSGGVIMQSAGTSIVAADVRGRTFGDNIILDSSTNLMESFSADTSQATFFGFEFDDGARITDSSLSSSALSSSALALDSSTVVVTDPATGLTTLVNNEGVTATFVTMGTATVVNGQDLDLGDIFVADLSVTTDGDIGDFSDGVSAVQVVGDTTLTAGSDATTLFDIALDNDLENGTLVHDFGIVLAGNGETSGTPGTVSFEGNTVLLTDRNLITLDVSSSGGDVTVVSNSAEVDGAINVAGGEGTITFRRLEGSIGIGAVSGPGADGDATVYQFGQDDAAFITAGTLRFEALGDGAAILTDNFTTGTNINTLELAGTAVSIGALGGSDIIGSLDDSVNLVVESSTTIRQGTGSLFVSGTTDLTAETFVLLDDPDNNFVGAVNGTADEIVLRDTNRIVLGDLEVQDFLGVTANRIVDAGATTVGDAINVGGTTSLTATTDIVLTAAHDFGDDALDNTAIGDVDAAAVNVTLNDVNDIRLGTLSVTGDLEVTTEAGAILDTVQFDDDDGTAVSEVIAVTGTTSLLAGVEGTDLFDIVLDNFEAHRLGGAVSATGEDIVIDVAGALEVGTITTRAGGGAGDATADATLATFDNDRDGIYNEVEGGDVDAAGDLVLRSVLVLSDGDDGALSVAGRTLLEAAAGPSADSRIALSNIALDNGSHEFGTDGGEVDIRGADVTLVAAGDLALGEVEAGELSPRFNADGDVVTTIALDNDGEPITGSLTVQAIGGVLTDTDGEAISVAGQTSLAASNADGSFGDIVIAPLDTDGSVIVEDIEHRFADSIDIEAGNLVLAGAGPVETPDGGEHGLILGVVSVTGDASLAATGSIIDTEGRTIAVQGETSILASNGVDDFFDVQLDTTADGDPGHSFVGAVSIEAEDIELVAASALTLGRIVTHGGGTDGVDASADSTISEFNNTAFEANALDDGPDASGDLTVLAKAAIGQAVVEDGTDAAATALSIAGRTRIVAGIAPLENDGGGAFFDVTLDNAANDFDADASVGADAVDEIDILAGNVTIADQNGLALGNIFTNGTLTVTAGGSVTDTDTNGLERITALGDVSIEAGSAADRFDIALDNNGVHDFSQAPTVSLVGEDIAISSQNGITFGIVTTQAGGGAGDATADDTIGFFENDFGLFRNDPDSEPPLSAAGDFTVSSNGAAIGDGDGAVFTIAGRTSLDTFDSGDTGADISLDNENAHSFGTGGDTFEVDARGTEIVLHSAADITLGLVDASETLTVDALGSITDRTVDRDEDDSENFREAITVGGATTLIAGNAVDGGQPIVLDNNSTHDFGADAESFSAAERAVDATGSAIVLIDKNDIVLGSLSAEVSDDVSDDIGFDVERTTVSSGNDSNPAQDAVVIIGVDDEDLLSSVNIATASDAEVEAIDGGIVVLAGGSIRDNGTALQTDADAVSIFVSDGAGENGIVDLDANHVLGRVLVHGTDVEIVGDLAELSVNVNAFSDFKGASAIDNDLTVSVNNARGNPVPLNVDSGFPVTLDAGATLGIDGDLTVGNDLRLTVDQGDLHVRGNVTTENGDVFISLNQSDGLIQGDVDSAGDIDLNRDVGDIFVTGETTAQGSLRVLARDGDTTFDKVIRTETGGVLFSVGKGNVTIGAGVDPADIIVDSAEDVSVLVGEGNVEIVDSIVAGGGVLLQPQDGTLLIKGNIDAEDNVEIAVGGRNQGEVPALDIDGAITSTGGGIDVEVANGDVDIDGALTARGTGTPVDPGQSITQVNAFGQSEVIPTPQIGANSGIAVLARNGSISVDGPATATTDVTVAAANGAIATTAELVAERGNIDVTAEGGGVRTEADLRAQRGSVNVSASGGVLDLQGGILAGNDATIAASGAKTATVAGDVDADGDITIDLRPSELATLSGDITAGGDAAIAVRRAQSARVTGNIVGSDVQIDSNVDDSFEVLGTLTANNSFVGRFANGNYLQSGAVVARNGSVDVLVENGNLIIPPAEEGSADDIFTAGSTLKLILENGTFGTGEVDGAGNLRPGLAFTAGGNGIASAVGDGRTAAIQIVTDQGFSVTIDEDNLSTERPALLFATPTGTFTEIVVRDGPVAVGTAEFVALVEEEHALDGFDALADPTADPANAVELVAPGVTLFETTGGLRFLASGNGSTAFHVQDTAGTPSQEGTGTVIGAPGLELGNVAGGDLLSFSVFNGGGPQEAINVLSGGAASFIGGFDADINDLVNGCVIGSLANCQVVTTIQTTPLQFDGDLLDITFVEEEEDEDDPFSNRGNEENWE